MVRLFIALLVLCTASISSAGIQAPRKLVAAAAGGSGEYTTLVDQTTNNSTVAMVYYRGGAVFSIPSSFTYVRATWNITSATGPCEMRFDDDANMTSEYISGDSFSPSSGANTIELSVGSLSSGTYYLAVTCAAGNLARSDTNNTSAMEYRFVDYVAGGGSWDITSTSARDWVLKIEYK